MQTHVFCAYAYPFLSLADKCLQPKLVGPCDALETRYYYDAKEGQCRDFKFGGCQGNDNNFLSLESCAKACAQCKDY